MINILKYIHIDIHIACVFNINIARDLDLFKYIQHIFILNFHIYVHDIDIDILNKMCVYCYTYVF